MSDEIKHKTRILIARGSKEVLEQMRDPLESGELFWEKSDPLNESEGELFIGTEDASDTNN